MGRGRLLGEGGMLMKAERTGARSRDVPPNCRREVGRRSPPCFLNDVAGDGREGAGATHSLDLGLITAYLVVDNSEREPRTVPCQTAAPSLPYLPADQEQLCCPGATRTRRVLSTLFITDCKHTIRWHNRCRVFLKFNNKKKKKESPDRVLIPQQPRAG